MKVTFLDPHIKSEQWHLILESFVCDFQKLENAQQCEFGPFSELSPYLEEQSLSRDWRIVREWRLSWWDTTQVVTSHPGLGNKTNSSWSIKQRSAASENMSTCACTDITVVQSIRYCEHVTHKYEKLVYSWSSSIDRATAILLLFLCRTHNCSQYCKFAESKNSVLIPSSLHYWGQHTFSSHISNNTSSSPLKYLFSSLCRHKIRSTRLQSRIKWKISKSV